HLVDRAGPHGHARRRQVHEAGLVLRAEEAVLPRRRAERGRGRRAVRLGPTRWLALEEAPPREELRVGEVVAGGGQLLLHRRRRPVGGQRGGGAPQRDGAAVGQGDDGDGLARLGPVEHVGQYQAPVGGAGVADGGRQIVGVGL